MQLHDERVEKSLLGAILVDNAVLDDCGVRFEDFYSAKAAAVFRSMARLIGSGSRADVETVAADLARAGDVVEPVYLAELATAFTAANAGFYAGKVRGLSRRRALKSMAEAAVAGADTEMVEPEEVVEDVERRLTDLTTGSGGEARRIGEYVLPALAIIERRCAGFQADGTWYLDGLSTGYRNVDAKLGGMKPGSMIVIGARTSIGKTAIALNMAMAMAKSGTPVGFFSCEQTAEQLVIRILAGEGNIDSSRLATGQLQAADFSRIMDCGQTIREAKLWMDDTPNIPLGMLKSRARLMRRKGVKAIFVDYLTLIRYDSKAPMWERVGEVSKQCKALARELDIPVIVLSQLGRQSEDKEPTLADLRQSGAVEEDADAVILLHRPRETDGDTIETRVIVAKNRHGDTGTAILMLNRRHVKFYERGAE